MPATSSRNTYATWELGDYAAMEAAPRYVELMGARVDITRVLPSSGSLSARRLLTRAFGGSLSSSGTLPRQATHKFLGTLTSSGIFQRGLAIRRTWAGTLGSSGALARARQRSLALAGTLGSSGTLLGGRSRLIGTTGLLIPTGALSTIARFYRSFQGTLGLTGALTRGKGWGKLLSGTLGTGGTFKLLRAIFPSGYLHPWGDLRILVRQALPPGGPPLYPQEVPEVPPLVGVAPGPNVPLLLAAKTTAPTAQPVPGQPGVPLQPTPRPPRHPLYPRYRVP